MLPFLFINHHGAKHFTDMWMECNLLLLDVIREKQILRFRLISILTLHWLHVSRSTIKPLFSGVEKLGQYNKDTTIASDLSYQLYPRKMLLGRICKNIFTSLFSVHNKFTRHEQVRLMRLMRLLLYDLINF